MMTSSNGNTFRVTGPLCGEFTGHRWIPLTKASDAELWCFLWSALNKQLSKQSWGWWFETPSRSLWRYCNVAIVMGKPVAVTKKVIPLFACLGTLQYEYPPSGYKINFIKIKRPWDDFIWLMDNYMAVETSCIFGNSPCVVFWCAPYLHQDFISDKSLWTKWTYTSILSKFVMISRRLLQSVFIIYKTMYKLHNVIPYDAVSNKTVHFLHNISTRHHIVSPLCMAVYI